MPKYEVSTTYFFRKTGEKKEPRDTIDLTEEEAKAFNDSHTGLLKPVRQTTQATVTAVREKKPTPKRTSRAKK